MSTPVIPSPNLDDLREAHRASLPDPALTPGSCATDDAELVLSPGYASAHRKLTTAMRRAALARYRLPWSDRGQYDVDHLVPVCLGGTNDLENLWPHPWQAPFTPRHKQSLEQTLRSLVRKGHVSLENAQRYVASDWVAAYLSFLGPAWHSRAERETAPEPPRGPRILSFVPTAESFED